jgi:glycosyltransferase involved in cell wall biosynthesis
MRPDRRLLLVVESGTDVRLVEGLAERFALTVLARRITGGAEISRPPPPSVAVEVGPASRVAFAGAVLRRLKGARRRFDATLVQGYALAALAANVAARASGPPATLLVCSPVEGYYRCRRGRSPAAPRYRLAEYLGLLALARLNARLARGYVVLSEHLADVVRGHGTRAPVHVVPIYGVDTERFSPGTEPRPALRARLGLPDDLPLLFFSSRIAPEKDAEALLAAVRRLADRGRPVRVLHCSGGYAAFREAAGRYGVADRVLVRDAVDPRTDLSALYRAADLCVQASRAEGLGFSPLEALACGTPVVASAVGGLRETIIDGETGWTYPAGDAGALADRILEALDAPVEGRRRAAAGRAMVETRFRPGPAFDRLAEVLA